MTFDERLFAEEYLIHSTRMRGWDYTSDGVYFVTICTKHRLPWFGEIQKGFMCLSDVGSVVANMWQQIPDHFPHITLGQWVVMPNHIHGVIRIEKPRSTSVKTRVSVETFDSNVSTNVNGSTPFMRPPSGSLGSVINQFKSICTKRIRIHHPDFAWQPRFHDHLSRTADETTRIERYILDNPASWSNDDLYIN